MDLFKNVGYVLTDMRRRYVARFERRAGENVSYPHAVQGSVPLFKKEGASQVRLCELADVEPMMMVRILDRMESEKVLERRPDPDDRRARRLSPRAKPHRSSRRSIASAKSHATTFSRA